MLSHVAISLIQLRVIPLQIKIVPNDDYSHKGDGSTRHRQSLNRQSDPTKHLRHPNGYNVRGKRQLETQ